MAKHRSTDGRFTPEHTDADVLAAVRAHDPAATSEIAEELGISRQGADRRLRSLRDAGEVSSKKIGAVLVWFMPRERGRPENAESAARTDPIDDTPDRSTDPPADAHDAHTAVEEDAPDAVDRVAEQWDGHPDQIEARKAAARAVLDYAREHGTVSKQDAIEHVRPEYPVEGQNARTWYRKTIRPILNEAAEYDQSARAYRLVDAEVDT